MKRVFAAAAIAFLSQGCVVEIEDEPADETTGEETKDRPEGMPGDGGGHRNGCGFEVINLINPTTGEMVSVVIPIECAPYYVYKGKPPEEMETYDEHEQSQGQQQEP